MNFGCNVLYRVVINVYFRFLISPTVILNVAKLAFIMKSNLAGLPYLVWLSPLGGIRDLKYTSTSIFNRVYPLRSL